MAHQEKSIFILSGQSNMAGRGGVNSKKVFDGLIPAECSPDPSKIFRLSAALKWEVANEPLHIDIDAKKTCGVGPGMAFANNVKDRVGTIGLVPCAIGGTALKEWAKGEKLYENMIIRAKASLEQNHCDGGDGGGGGGGGGVIKALLWYQGESDTSALKDAKAYKAEMEKFIHDVRSDLNILSLPIIQVALASGDDKYIEMVRESQKSIEVPNVVTVDAKGLKLKEDNLHLTSEAQVQLGHMLAAAYLSHFETH